MSTSAAEEGSRREDSRWATWWSSWRVATRMARRDVRRHRGRSALIVVMVFLPVVAVIGGVVLISSEQVSPSEAVGLQLGAAVASLQVDGDGTTAVDQAGSASYLTTCRPSCAGNPPQPGPARPIPGWASGHEAAALQQLTGGRVAKVTSSSEKVVLGSRRIAASVLGVDGAAFPWLTGRVTLVSGRWPTSADEVLVTRVGVERGLPTSGSLTVVHQDEAAASTPVTRELTVVGTATGFVSDGHTSVQPADLVTLPDAISAVTPPRDGSFGGSAPSVQYLLDRPAAPTPAEVASLNTYGLRVAAPGIDPDDAFPDPNDPGGPVFAAFTALAAVGLLLLTSLLAGPAFAVSAARQRRTLALAAANGATRAQVRRTVLGQALVLGVLAAALGGAVGLGGSWLVLRWLAATHPATWWAPYDAPWAPTSIVIGSAVVSSVVAALLPARGLGRLDIVRVMRGQEVSPRLHRGLPVVGLVLLVVGTLALAFGFVNSVDTSNPKAAIGITSGVLLLVVGALCVIPATLALLGRLTSRMPVTVRMATRDAARQRGRATPTVAAVMAGVAVLATLLTVLASSDRHNELTYRPFAASGTARIYGDVDGSGTAIVDSVRAAAPTVQVSTMLQVASPMGAPGAFTVVGALRSGCPISTVTRATVGPLPVDTATATRCTSLSSVDLVPFGSIQVADATYLRRALDLDARQLSALEAGAMLVVDGVGVPPRQIDDGSGQVTVTNGQGTVDVVDGAVTMATATVTPDAATGGFVVQGTPRTTKVPALAVPRARFGRIDDAGAVVTPATASRLGWPTTAGSIVAFDPSGPMSRSTQDAIQRALDARATGATIDVERGYVGDTSIRLASLIALGVVAFLTLVATLIATALSQAESQAFLGTLAAVGATRGTRRRIAGAQAGFLALAGVLLGVLVGLVPGILMARAATGPRPYDEVQTAATLVIPWLELLAPVVVVPLVAALLAWASIRTTPTVTRRLS